MTVTALFVAGVRVTVAALFVATGVRVTVVTLFITGVRVTVAAMFVCYRCESDSGGSVCLLQV